MLEHAWFAVQVALAWYFALSLAAAALALVARRAARAFLRRRPRANAVLALRVFPMALSAGGVILLVLPAFAWLEPFGGGARDEHLGVTGLVFAASGAALVVASFVRGLAAAGRTRRWMHALHGNAAPLVMQVGPERRMLVSESPIPSVVLDGVFTPRLFVSRSVLEELTPEELERAVAHEDAHHRAHDNIKRRLLTSLPDLIAWTPLARDFEAVWRQAAEVEADAAAAGTEAHALALASALVKVARLAGGRPAADVGCAAFYDDGPVAERIRLLCTQPSPRPKTRGRLFSATAGLIMFGVMVNAASILPGVHRMTEALVGLP